MSIDPLHAGCSLFLESIIEEERASHGVAISSACQLSCFPPAIFILLSTDFMLLIYDKGYNYMLHVIREGKDELKKYPQLNDSQNIFEEMKPPEVSCGRAESYH